jgi:hypothetical protein
MTVEYANRLGDLPESTRGSGRADLLAGSAGYRHFVDKLSQFISPEEAVETRKKFTIGRRVFWLVVIGYVFLYFAVNELLGPFSLRLTAVGNDVLRGLLLLVAVILVRWVGIGVAAQLLLPLASWCFLPMPLTNAVDYWQGPLLFGLIATVLFACGWCIDMGVSPTGKWALLLRFIPWFGLFVFILLNIAAALWIIDKPAPPVFSILAALAAVFLLEIGKKESIEASDVDFLYAAAWKRWRFFITGRILAIIFGIIPFILFTSLLDHQGQLEECLQVQETPEIIRVPNPDHKWHAFFWRHEGRFLTDHDLETAPDDHGPVIRAMYMMSPLVLPPIDPDKMPPECRVPAAAIPLPSVDEAADMRNKMEAMNTQRMTREEFLRKIERFEPLRLNSRCRLIRRDPDASGFNFVEVSFHQAGSDGTVFAETPELRTLNPQELEGMVQRYSVSKWIFLVYGIFGFVFLWRRGGDSSLARWIGIWLMGASLVPLLTSSDDTLPHLQHWMWQQSVMYHWNTVAAAGGPVFSLLFIATAIAAFLWMLQISPAVCWTYICWPTRILPQFPIIVRELLIIGKLAAVMFVQFMLFFVIIIGAMLIFKSRSGIIEFTIFGGVSTFLFIVTGWILRRFTRASSEVPKLGIMPVLAILALNLSTACYAPIFMFISTETVPGAVFAAGAFFGCVFIGLMSWLILKRDFLRVRAVDGFTTLLLLLFVPVVVNQGENIVPVLLVGGPFFHQRGAAMVAILFVVLVFPAVHHWLHELLLLISLPKVRKIERTVEHALEHIVDAETDQERLQMVSGLFEKLRVPRYLLMSRAPKNIFAADINKLDREVPARIELSSPLRHFLGKRRHFIDLHTMPFEWLFFFHQFELHRIASATGCRYLLPVSVGDSLRALILIPEGPGESVMANPAVSANINNFGIAAALSRPRA